MLVIDGSMDTNIICDPPTVENVGIDTKTKSVEDVIRKIFVIE